MNNGFGGWGAGGPYIPFVGDWGEGSEDHKPLSERYHVYVNGDYVGDKECAAQGDGGYHGITDYLKTRGFTGLSLDADGDRVRIHTEDTLQADEIKKHLGIYLHIR